MTRTTWILLRSRWSEGHCQVENTTQQRVTVVPPASAVDELDRRGGIVVVAYVIFQSKLVSK